MLPDEQDQERKNRRQGNADQNDRIHGLHDGFITSGEMLLAVLVLYNIFSNIWAADTLLVLSRSKVIFIYPPL